MKRRGPTGIERATHGQPSRREGPEQLALSLGGCHDPGVHIDELVLFSSDVSSSENFIAANFPAVAERRRGYGSGRVRYVPGNAISRPDRELLSAFWKFSIFTDSVDRVAASLGENDVATSQPGQFLDIGYLCHLHEPGGNEIELLQRSFSPPLAPPSPTGFRGEETLGLITLRVTDIASTLRLLVDGLGMARLASMHVGDGRPDPFRLEFLAFTRDKPPETDLFHIANREWLYQRAYTIVEIQHGPSLKTLGNGPDTQEVGLSHISILCDDVSEARSRLHGLDFEVTADSDGSVSVATVDGHRFVLDVLG